MKRPYLVVAAGTAVAAVSVFAIAAVNPNLLRTSNTMRVEDFGAYWTGTKAALAGTNAYDADNLLPRQQEIEPDRTQPVAAWSPPWTFTAFAPFAPLDFAVARWVWRFVQIGTVFAAVAALWGVYRGPPGKLIWAWSAALMWYPTLQTLGLGQHSNLVLLGVAGWLAFHTADRPFAAGACLAVVLVKPQNVYLLGLLGVVWTLDRRAWRVAAGAVAGAAAFTLLTLAVNPRVFHDYVSALAARPPSYTVPPTVGMLLRMLFGESNFWLVFLPPLVGVMWALWYYVRNRSAWDWAERLPVVIFVSCITSPYGWMYDQVLFLIPLVAILARAAHRPDGVMRVVMAVAALTALCLALHGAGFREVTFVWHAPLCLALYLMASARLGATHSLSNNS
ncbi:MAG TPA: glycosyltransferase family 87 protein [Micromonosporaceae bacterium]